MILSDNWIKRQCIPPTHLLITISGSESRSMEERLCWEGITHTKEQLESLCNRYHATKLRTESEVRGTGWKPMITPFHDHLVREREQRVTADGGYLDRVVSYGVSSYGYDIRCSSEFKVFTNVHSGVIDPKNFDEEKNLVPINTPVCIIPPNSFALARTVERFDIPRDVLAICLGKSTYARCGIIVNVTPAEPEWEGYLTLEFSNTTTLPAKIYADEGVAQLLFLKGERPCDVSYKDRNGKYMNQEAQPIAPRI